MTNEFEDMYDDDFTDDTIVSEEKTNSGEDTKKTTEELIATGNQGLVYDYNTAPDTVKGPERENLDGKTVTIQKADIILPPPEKEWEWSKQKTSQYKPCMFVVKYDDGQQEYYSGVRVFRRKDKNNNDKYSHPQIQNNAKTQASKLKTTYAEYKGVKPEEITLKQFMSFLNSKPKAVIKSEGVENPETEKITYKNFVSEFVKEQ